MSDNSALSSQLAALLERAKNEILSCDTTVALEQLRILFLGKKSLITQTMQGIKDLTHEQRRDLGRLANEVKEEISHVLTSRFDLLRQQEVATQLSRERIDITLPGRQSQSFATTSGHPISATIEMLHQICQRMGFTFVEGPEIESEYHNFDALNIPPDHPAREMQDTFYVDIRDAVKLQQAASRNNNLDSMGTDNTHSSSNRLLRTHTSAVQVKHGLQPPLRVASMGKVYRSDYPDQTHSPMFHQLEMMYIDRDVSVANLKHCWQTLMTSYFHPLQPQLRFRTSYFPFTEPSIEVDIGCMHHTTVTKADGHGSEQEQQSPGLRLAATGEEVQRWLELGGAGMVHPRVLANMSIDAGEWQGFALGIGIERLAMLKYGIADIRHFYDGDIRLLHYWNTHYC